MTPNDPKDFIAYLGRVIISLLRWI